VRASVLRVIRRYGIAGIVAASVLWVGWDGGTYDPAARNTLAIIVWWAILLAVSFAHWPLAAPTRAAYFTGSLLAAFAGLTLVSMSWAESDEDAFAEFNRASLYLGIYVLTVLASRRSEAGAWADGLALGIVGIALLALGSRFFPDVASIRQFQELLPGAYTRLSYPVGYWNGLAILCGLAVPLLLRAGLAARGAVAAGLFVAPVPALASVIYLASSRGGVAVASAGALSLVVLAGRRVAAIAGVTVAGVGCALAVATLLDRHELVNGPLESSLAADQGRSAALLVTLVCLGTGLASMPLDRGLARVTAPSVMGERLVLALFGGLVVAVALAADPIGRFRAFKEPPQALEEPTGDFVRAHLLSGNGSGRWQLWASALDQFESRPLFGRGAGSYEGWWSQHGSLAMFVRDAHSLYAEVLGELGLAGMLLLGGALATGLVVGLMRLVQRQRPSDRLLVAGLLAAFVAFACGLAVDWMWELTVVGVVGIVLLGLLTGPATSRGLPKSVDATSAPMVGPRGRFGLALTVVLVSWLLMVAHAIPLFASLELRASERAATRGDTATAVEAALSARNLEPWATAPLLQLALVEERIGRLSNAREWIREAIREDPSDWRLRLVAARIEVKRGAVRSAAGNFEAARRLNPRSPLFVRP